MSEPVVSVQGVGKHYAGVHALDGVDLDIFPGEVLAIVGDNGAGKTTLVKILSGVEAPTSGNVLIDGKPADLKSALDARRLGIETVYQNLALAPNAPVWANVFLGREILTRGVLGHLGQLNRGAMRRAAIEELSRLHITVPGINLPLKVLSGGQRQAVAVARAVAWASKLVIMDEPTAALGPEQQAQVLDLIREVRDRGVPVMLITHSLQQVMDVADRIAAFRRGELMATVRRDETTEEELIAYITGLRRQTGQRRS